ncbi:MAG: sialate O-acetylesterase [Bacillales bacterium]|nr:sialate O-acetylesterase [Bacillales bacterium]
MNKLKFFFLLSTIVTMLCVNVSCGGNTNPTTSQTPIVEDNEVAVIVMSGQSNMHGSTYFDNGQQWLKKYLDTRDIDMQPFVDGINEVQTSFRGYYPYGGGNPSANCYASNMEDNMAGKFLPTKLGMGYSQNDMGPEIGLTHVLRDYASEEKPIFLIKSAFSGAGFSGHNDYNWKATKDDGKVLWDETKLFVHNNLALIEDMGFKPVVKAWLWHQGESDANSVQQATDYLVSMRNLLGEFREEFASYAPYEEGESIAFVDCTIYDGKRLTYSAVDTLNQTKKTLSEESDMNFLINASTKDLNGMNFEIGGHSNIGGCDGIYHYTTEDCFKLGEEYGKILVDNFII